MREIVLEFQVVGEIEISYQTAVERGREKIGTQMHYWHAKKLQSPRGSLELAISFKPPAT